MINITKISPSLIQFEGLSPDQEEALKDKLSYNDRKALFAWQKFKNNKYFAKKFSDEEFKERLDKLKSSISKNLMGVMQGKVVTYSGLLARVGDILPSYNYSDLVKFPERELIAFDKIPPAMRYYQADALKVMLETKHAALSICTGGGKSLIILNLAKEIGLKTTIFCPSTSIANQLYIDLSRAFGKKNVGLFGDGSKEFNKLFTVAIAKSLINIKKGTPAYEALSASKVAIVDESHMVATETQKAIMLGLLKDAPYRFFLSATQFRSDGSDLLLEGITGPVVYDYPIQQAIEEGFLAKPTFYILETEYGSKISYSDPLKILNEGVYKNRKLHEAAAKIANKYLKLGKKVMVMIDRVDQFKLLVNHFDRKPGFAYGNLTKAQKKVIPEYYHKMKTEEVVEDFNNGVIDLMVGTTAISMGTDTRPVDVLINLQGGRSEVKFMQLLGRATRKVPGKESFIFIDFDVIDVPSLHGWSMLRKKMFKEITEEVFVITRGANG